MKAIEFISKDLHVGDKVRLRIEGSDQTHTGYFGGYKMYDGIEPDLDYVYPVFYREGKKGQMVRRSIFGDHHSTSICLRNIKEVEKIVTYYRHIGYFNNPQDCYNLSLRGHGTALKAWKDGEGAFHNVDNDEVFDDIENDEDTRILEGGKYAVRFSGIYETDKQEDYGGYIDIFERIQP